MTPFAAIRTKKVYEEIIEQIEALITAGDLKPGQQLPPERELAQRLGVSRPSMREAFSILETLGVIEIRAGDGSYVAKRLPASLLSPMALSLDRTRRRILESYEVRQVLEIEAARLAAERATAEDRAEMGRIYDRLAAAYLGGRVPEDGDTSLHLAVARMTHNEVLCQLLDDLQGILLKISHVFYRSVVNHETGEEQIEEAVSDFNHIAQAVVAGDPDRAAVAMKTHLDRVKPMIISGLKEEDID
ncbi:MAG TPA: FadR/GntR family transcriptional regulator [Bacillota bacterium]